MPVKCRHGNDDDDFSHDKCVVLSTFDGFLLFVDGDKLLYAVCVSKELMGLSTLTTIQVTTFHYMQQWYI